MTNLATLHESSSGDDLAPPATGSGPAGWGHLAVAGWVLLVVASRRQGDALIAELGREALRLNAPPLVAYVEPALAWPMLIPLLVGLGAVACSVRVLPLLSWRQLLAASVALTAIWAVALAVGRSPAPETDPGTLTTEGLTHPLILEGDEYLLDVPLVGDDPREFLTDFTSTIDQHVTHVRSHPPGFLMLLWSMDGIGLGGTGWAAVLCILGGAAAVPAVLLALRQVADEPTARRAAPFVALAPAALWIATTADALFAGVGAWAVALIVLSTGRSGRRSWALAGAGGLLWGAGALLSYGLVLLAVPIGIVVLVRRRIDLVVPVAAGIGVMLAAAAAAGFWWLDGLETTRREYLESVASTRPQGYFIWANLAALAIVVGPATAAGLARLRDRRVWLLAGGFGAAILVADLSGMSKGEVERIWLPFAVWLPVACVSLDTRIALSEHKRERHPRRVAVPAGWLTAQVAAAMAVQVLVRTRW